MNTLWELQQLGREGNIRAGRCSSQHHGRWSSLFQAAVSRAPHHFAPSQVTTKQKQLEGGQPTLVMVFPDHKLGQETSRGKVVLGDLSLQGSLLAVYDSCAGGVWI